MKRLALILLFALFAAVGAFAQSDDEADKSRLTRYVEDTLSSDNMRIRLNGIEGALSSDARIASITIADREGVWLTITNARLVWSRLALLRGRLDIESLTADSIDMPRRPGADESAPAPEAGGFAIPELPVAVIIERLDVPEVRFGQPVFDLASVLKVKGALRLDGGSLDAALAVERIDGPGGSLTLAAKYAAQTKVFDIDFVASEPRDGVLANVLGIHDVPALKLEVKGSGPVDRLDIDLTLDADDKRALAGSATLRRDSEGLRVVTDLGGPLSVLIAPAYRPFFGEDSRLHAAALLRDAGEVQIDNLSINSGVVDLKASGATTADKFLRRLKLDATVADRFGDILLPVPGGDTTLGSATLTLDYGAATTGGFDGRLDIKRLVSAGLTMETLLLDLDGVATGLNDPATRALTFDVSGLANGIASQNPAVVEALGKRMTIAAKGDWRAGSSVNLEYARFDAANLALDLAGKVFDYVFDGRLAVKSSSIAPFGGLAGRDLAGGIDLSATGTVSPLSGGFNLTLDGTGDDLQLDVAGLDGVIAGRTRLTGRVERSERGIVAEALVIESDEARVAADGRIASDAANFDFDLSVNDIAALNENGSGRLTAKGTARGEDGPIRLAFSAALPSGTLAGRAARDIALGFDGVTQDAAVSGTVNGDGFLDGERVTLAGDISIDGEEKLLSGLVFSAGAARFTGDVRQGADGLLSGELDLAAANIDSAAALALADASGAVNAKISLSERDGKQGANIVGDASALRIFDNRIGAADVDARIDDLFGVPKIDGAISGRDVSIGGFDVSRFDGTAKTEAGATNFDVTATLADGATAAARGALSEIEGGWSVALAEARLAKDALAARLAAPSTVTLRGETVTLDDLRIDVGGGAIAASGTAGETFDLSLDIKALPLAIANAVRSDLGLAGTITGTARVTGSRDAPDIAFDIAGKGLAATQSRAAGLPPLDVTARGDTDGRIVNTDATVTGAGGIRLDAKGRVPLSGDGLDVTVNAAAFPLATLAPLAPGQDLRGTLTGTVRASGRIDAPRVTFDISADGLSARPAAGLAPLAVTANGVFADNTVQLSAVRASGRGGFSAAASGTVPLNGTGLNLAVTLDALPLSAFSAQAAGQNPSGTVSGTATVTGTLADPQASFRLEATNVSAAALAEAGAAPVSIAASGRYGGNAVTLDSARISGPQGLGLTASGRIPFSGSGLDIRIDGEAPLALANRFLAERGATASGVVNFSGGVSGSLAAPQPNLLLSAAGARVTDPLSNLALTDINLLASVRGEIATVNRLTANLSGGGSVSVTGNVSTNAGAGFPADLAIRLTNARYADGEMVAATVSGSLALTGPLVRDPLLSGGIDIERAEIIVPDNFGGADALPDIKHRRPPHPVRQTLKRARALEPPVPSSRPSILNLDVQVRAPRRIFIRGRGLDAEVGGSVRLTGPVTNIAPVGGFELIRGRLEILGKRIVFDSGSVSLVGDLDPYVDLTAESRASDATVFITVRGRVSDLEIAFSAQPALPQDEALARLIFGRSISELSPLQIAQLAAAAAELAGGANTSLVGSLRKATGLDDLDVVTDEDGNAAVRAGRYIQENIYLGVETGAKGKTKATVNIDITDDLTARGAVDANGESELGVFYEKDY